MYAESSIRPEDGLKRTLGLSALLHAAILSSLLVSNIYSHRGELWGGTGGGSVTIGLVGSVPGIPLPRPDVVTTSRVVDQTKGLYKAEPKPIVPETDATTIPKFEKNKPPRYITRPSKTLENPATPPTNAIPYGEGGAPAVPYTSFSMGAGTQAGLGFSGVGGGNFGTHFPWYVEAVQRRISSNWLQSMVDPSLRFAPRCVVTFQILRDGTATNIQVLQSSGNKSVDTSAVRSVLASSPMDRLPAEYNGTYVSVEFWFEFRR